MTDDLNALAKTQTVRLMDVFLVGPLMAIGGIVLGGRGYPVLGVALAAFGATTIYYNAENYERVARSTRG